MVLQLQLQLLLVICGQSGTGAHGVHLHLECATTLVWQCATFLNCSQQLNIPNVSGTVVHYDGTTPPVPPPPSEKSNSKKWGWFMNRKVRYNR